MILVVDNHDSFVHNVARYFAILGAATRVVRDDAIDLDAIAAMAPSAIVISPGPCSPLQAGAANAVLAAWSGRLPILGVCLGHQCIGAMYGGRVARARHPMHGLPSIVRHRQERLFQALPDPLTVGRYHSLIVEPTPAMERELNVDAWSEEGEIMALSHRHHPTYGVQFHPESVLTPSGLDLFAAFLATVGAWPKRRRSADALA